MTTKEEKKWQEAAKGRRETGYQATQFAEEVAEDQEPNKAGQEEVKQSGSCSEPLHATPSRGN